MSEPWYLLPALEDSVPHLGEATAAERAGRILTALAASVGDALTSAPKRRTLKEGAARASRILDRMRAVQDVDEASPSYIAGRLAMMVDVLALIVSARAVDELPELARAELETLGILYERPLGNNALADARAISEEAACRSLRVCRELGLVETERVGRNNVNRLTPLGQALFDDGLLPCPDGSGVYDMARVVRASSPAELGKKAALPQLDL